MVVEGNVMGVVVKDEGQAVELVMRAREELCATQVENGAGYDGEQLVLFWLSLHLLYKQVGRQLVVVSYKALRSNIKVYIFKFASDKQVKRVCFKTIFSKTSDTSPYPSSEGFWYFMTESCISASPQPAWEHNSSLYSPVSPLKQLHP